MGTSKRHDYWYVIPCHIDYSTKTAFLTDLDDNTYSENVFFVVLCPLC